MWPLRTSRHDRSSSLFKRWNPNSTAEDGALCVESASSRSSTSADGHLLVCMHYSLSRVVAPESDVASNFAVYSYSARICRGHRRVFAFSSAKRGVLTRRTDSGILVY